MIWVPADRLLAVLDRHQVTLTDSEGRFVYDLRNGRQDFVSLRRADNLLTRLGLGWWWHIPAADGGLADIYEQGAQYGKPDNTARLYATRSERDEAKNERRNARNRARSPWSNPEPRVCADAKCDQVFTPMPGRSAQGRKYCSNRCKSRATATMRRERLKAAA